MGGVRFGTLNMEVILFVAAYREEVRAELADFSRVNRTERSRTLITHHVGVCALGILKDCRHIQARSRRQRAGVIDDLQPDPI